MPSAPPRAAFADDHGDDRTRRIIISRRFTAMASAIWRSSEPMPGYAPGVSMSAMTGSPNFSASASGAALCGNLPDRRSRSCACTFSFESRPFWCVTTHTAMLADRGQAAGHRLVVAEERSPCSSIQSVKQRESNRARRAVAHAGRSAPAARRSGFRKSRAAFRGSSPPSTRLRCRSRSRARSSAPSGPGAAVAVPGSAFRNRAAELPSR